MSTRSIVAAFAALALIACAAKEVPLRERVTFEKIERTAHSNVAMSEPVRAASGNVFVIVHLKEDPPPAEDRRWLSSTMKDWDGRTYEAKFADINKGESDHAGFLGRRIKTVHPNSIRVVFEVPQTAILRGVTVPHPISLFETPVRISDPKSAPRIVRRVEPQYPEAARRLAWNQLLKFEVLVLPDGRVAGADVIQGPQDIGEAAAAAIRQWKYEPVVVDGKAVPALIEVHIDYHR